MVMMMMMFFFSMKDWHAQKEAEQCNHISDTESLDDDQVG